MIAYSIIRFKMSKYYLRFFLSRLITQLINRRLIMKLRFSALKVIVVT